jgi:hypothetical protein
MMFRTIGGHAVDDYEDLLESILPEGWETDGYGLDSCLICPHGYTIEQDGRCPEGCVSPLRELGMI